MSRKHVLLLLTAVAIAFILGFCFGATDFNESFKGVSWTNILSSITTLSGFLLAFASYNQWLSNKKRVRSQSLVGWVEALRNPTKLTGKTNKYSTTINT